MIVASFIPFFLAVQLPIQDGAWPYGPEYTFTAYINLAGIPQCPPHDPTCGDPHSPEHRITFRLHCIPKRNDTLSCSVYPNDFGMIGEEVNRLRYTPVPFELFFNEEGIESIITSQRVYDLNILKMIAELLHPGDSFNDIGGGTFEDVTASTIGRCNTTFNVNHRFGREDAKTRFPRGFQLKLPRLHMTSTETLIIDKTTNLNSCSRYADGFRKYGDTVISERLQANLENMVSHMEISETSFSSSTTRKATAVSNNTNITYDITEITKLILEDIQPAARDPPVIVKPSETKISY